MYYFKMNIIVIVIDALRPDHLGVNGYHRDTSPNIDNLLKEGTSFLNAYTVLPRTNPSITSILTGIYPHSHGIRLVYNKSFDESINTLPNILRNHGYRTAYIGQPIHKHGLEKGFDDFILLKWQIKNRIKKTLFKAVRLKEKTGVAYQYTDTAISWIKKNSKKKFFFCLHYNELHWPYQSPFEDIFEPDYKGKHDFNTLGDGKFSRGDLVFGHIKLPKEELEHAVSHYDSNLKYIDAQLARLLEFLKRKGMYDKTLIILTSDHGENFGEHGFYFQHGASLYQPSLKVPLIFANPTSIPKGKKIMSNVQIIDIMPTVLEMLKIPLLDKIDGKSLLPLIENKTNKARDFIFAESIEEHFKGNKRIFFPGIKGKWRAMIVGDWKIIYIPHPKENIFELYNLKDDLSESNNLIDKEKKVAEEMKKKILNFLKPQSNEGEIDKKDLTEKSKKLLKNLGYID